MRFLLIFFSVLLAQFNPVLCQVSFFESNLPIVIINTNGRQIPDEPKIQAHMGIIDNGPGQLNTTTDPFNGYDGNIGIELRGSSSRILYDKKSFGIETWTEDLADTSVSILGMPREEDWVLYGPYGDKTLLRNVLAFKMGRDQGRYASHTRICEVILNDRYWGVYVFMEKIKRDNDRVDISRLNPDEISGDELTGGYIVKLDKFDGNNSGAGFISPYPPPNRTRSEQVIFFQHEYPDVDEIVPQQAEYIKNYVTGFEDALRTGSFLDNISGYKSFIDVESFVDYAIVNEVTRNIDAYRLSTFLYKDRIDEGGKLFIGPIWDYNLAFGNADYCEGWSTEGWAWDFNQVCNEDFWLIPFWWHRFLSDIEFATMLNNRWVELRNGPYGTEKLLSYIDSVSTGLAAARQRNFERWDILGSYIWPNYFVGDTYDQEVKYLKSWLSDRLDWLDMHFTDIITAQPPAYPENQIVEIYPNPFHSELKMRVTGPENNNLQIEIFNSRGEKVIENTVKNSERDEKTIWHGHDMKGNPVTPGMYFITIRSKDKIISSRKIIRD